MLPIESEIIHGKLSDLARVRFINALKRFEGKTVEITVKRKRRSLKQNAFWWTALDKYVVPIFRDAGGNWSSYKVHEMLMHELGYEDTLVKPDGTIYASRQSSTELDTVEWEEFMERARAHLMMEYGIFMPMPREDIPD